ncbi:hypothetical protein, partial [Parafilimonas sp.]|uniref:hypothetical protein n=1 Tax=Parafilimonas sp. TaxID=1969739 RepID=UPI0039E34D35
TTNGMTFSASGVFYATGKDTIVAKGAGSPADTGVTSIPINISPNTCMATINITTFSYPGSWEFTDSLKKITYSGVLDSAYFTTNTDAVYNISLNIKGAVGDSIYSGDTTFDITIIGTSSLTSGTYTQATDYGKSHAVITLYYSSAVLYGDVQNSTVQSTLTVNLTLDRTSGLTEGTFYGNLYYYPTGTLRKIINGKFKTYLKQE